MLNHITIQGRFTKAPELRYTTTQKPVVSFTLAVERDFSPVGEQRGADFIPCNAWNGTAEFVPKYFTKGSMAIVSGHLQMRDWTDKDGNKHTVAEVVADKVYFCGKKDAAEAPSTETEGELPF